MKKFLLLLSILMLVVSCKRDNENEPEGLYEERGPIDERTKMDFNADDNRVIIYYEDGTNQEFNFTVSQDESIISLTPLNSADYPAINYFYFYKDPDTFFMGNIYPTETADMEFGRPDDDEE